MLLFDSTLSSQPQEAVELDASHPLASFCTVAWLGHNPDRNFADSSACSVTSGTGLTYASATPDGLALVSDGVSGSGRVLVPRTQPAQETTWVYVGSSISLTSLGRPMTGSNGQSTLGRYDWFYNAGIWEVVSVGTTNGRWQWSTFSSFSGVVVIVFDGFTTPRVYLNGVPATLSLVQTGSGTPPTPNPNLAILGRTDTDTRNFNGRAVGVFEFATAVSEEMALSLSANPWQLYRVPSSYWMPTGTTYTLSPDSTLSNSGWTATGAASLHAALAAGDADYIGANTDAAVSSVSLSDPATALTLTNATLTVRARLN